MTRVTKPRLDSRQLFNMNFGFLGIQFGWGLQLANMSAVYERLGARPDQVPLLWLAAPMTGLLVQPIVGALSDRTWGRLGRRRPYFLTGAIFASIALFFMPTSTSLWMAASLLWVLDASINVSMEPFRAFVADKLDASQRTTGFVMQSLFIGVGASLAGALLSEVGAAIRGMPKTMRQLAVVQVLTWLGLFCMWLFFVPATARHVFGAVDPQSPLYARGMEWGGFAFAFYSITCFLVALVLPKIAATIGRKWTHAVALVCGSVGLLS